MGRKVFKKVFYPESGYGSKPLKAASSIFLYTDIYTYMYMYTSPLQVSPKLKSLEFEDRADQKKWTQEDVCGKRLEQKGQLY